MVEIAVPLQFLEDAEGLGLGQSDAVGDLPERRCSTTASPVFNASRLITGYTARSTAGRGPISVASATDRLARR